MWLTADQELRREFLLIALGKQPDVEAAIIMAARMERFVLDRQPATDGRPHEVEAAEVAAEMTAAGIGLEPSARQETKITKRRWSEADDARLRQFWQSSNLSLEEIAEELGRTVPSLYSRARALGMEKRRPNPKTPSAPVAAAPAAEPPPAEPPAAETAEAEASDAGTSRAAAPGKREEAGDDEAARSCKAADPAGTKSMALCPNARRQAMQRERHRFSAAAEALPAGRSRHGVGRKTSTAISNAASPMFVDSVIQFLRSRDYSVVRVGEGQFRLDGRRIMTADELREKANQVRKSLGQPPFASLMDQVAS